MGQHGADLVAREDHRQPLGTPGPDQVTAVAEEPDEHLAIEEQEGAEGLILGIGGDLGAPRRDMREALISGSPNSEGWRLPWKRMNFLIQRSRRPKVRIESWCVCGGGRGSGRGVETWWPDAFRWSKPDLFACKSLRDLGSSDQVRE